MKKSSKGFLIIFFLSSLVALLSQCNVSSYFYVPSKNLTAYPDTSLYIVEEVSIHSTLNKKLHGWFLKPKAKKIVGTVLQLHGNAGNISNHYTLIEPLVNEGFQVLVFDYQGYGKSEGKPSQQNVLNDALNVLHYLKTREDVKNTKFILFGQSLGGHLSCVVAAKEQHLIDALVVEAPFTGHELMAMHVVHNAGFSPWIGKALIDSKYNAIDYIDKVKVPKLFIHSTEDDVCPFYMGKQLYEKAVSPKEFWEIKGGHILASQLYSPEFVEHFKKIIQ